MKIIKLLILLSATLTACSLKQNTIIQKEPEYVVIEPEEYDYDDVSDYELTRESMFDVDQSRYYFFFYLF